MWAGSLSEAGFRGSCATSARIFAAEAIRHGRDSSRVITPGAHQGSASRHPPLPQPGRTAFKGIPAGLTSRISPLATAGSLCLRGYSCPLSFRASHLTHPSQHPAHAGSRAISTGLTVKISHPFPRLSRTVRRLRSYSCWAASGSATRMRPQYSQTMIFLP